MISTIVKLLNLPACSIDEQVDAVAAMREGHYLVRGDHVKDVVVQLRNEYDALRKQHAADLMRAREEQREACAREMESACDGALAKAKFGIIVRATPLTATPLAGRIRALEADAARLREALEAALESTRCRNASCDHSWHQMGRAALKETP